MGKLTRTHTSRDLKWDGVIFCMNLQDLLMLSFRWDQRKRLLVGTEHSFAHNIISEILSRLSRVKKTRSQLHFHKSENQRIAHFHKSEDQTIALCGLCLNLGVWMEFPKDRTQNEKQDRSGIDFERLIQVKCTRHVNVKQDEP